MTGVASDVSSANIEPVTQTLRSGGFQTLARVSDTSRAIDLAIAIKTDRLGVVRCVACAASDDHTALATMISQGDFIWGAIVYSESVEPDPLGLIESFHVDQLDQLVSRLTELREAFHEAG